MGRSCLQVFISIAQSQTQKRSVPFIITVYSIETHIKTFPPREEAQTCSHAEQIALHNTNHPIHTAKSFFRKGSCGDLPKIYRKL